MRVEQSIGFAGGCAPFRLFAQNRWAPLGAIVRKAPEITAPGFANYDGNESIAVTGWVHGGVAYPTNQPPFNNDIWFHVATGGWVSFAAVRAVPTVPDPTGFADGGQSVEADPACQGEVH